MKNPTLWIIVVALVIIGGSMWWKTNQPNTTTPEPSIPTGIVLYFGDTCPHCKIVAQFIEDNKIKEKVTFEEKEVYNNQANAKELAEVAKTCGLATDAIGVPFLWDGKACIQGQDQTINFFKDKAGIK
ncbi:MAG: hypothetical protein Q7S57_02260 [bacterium]|nr:hypothetical protein [bacterium]